MKYFQTMIRFTKRKLDRTENIFRVNHGMRMPGLNFVMILVILTAMMTAACSAHSQVVPENEDALTQPRTEEQEAEPETVTINGKEYVVPEPWSGHRITAPKFEYSDFSKIPVEFTHNESKIYILDIAYEPLVDLLQAAKKDGIALKVESAYRSERYQKKIFKRMLAEDRTFEDIVRYVAPPGYSNHMLGRAVDFFPSNWDFAEIEAYEWLRENAGRFGFEETYSRFNPMHMPWEAWHWNYTGKREGEVATANGASSGNSDKE